MTFDNSFTLQKMTEDAKKQFDQAASRISGIESTLERRMDGKSRGNLILTLIFSVLWGAAYVYAYTFVLKRAESIPELIPKIALVTLIASLVLVAAIAAGDFLQLKYYGTILSAKDKLVRLRSRVETGRSSMAGNTKTFLQRRASQWAMPFQTAPSVLEEASQIEAQLSNLEAVNSGLITNLKNWLFYPVCIAWTVVGCMAFRGTAYRVLAQVGLGGDVAKWIQIIGTAIACIVVFILAKLLWGVTNCSVTNLTLFVTAVGPLVLALLMIAAVIVIFLLQLALTLLAGAIALACFCGSVSGG